MENMFSSLKINGEGHLLYQNYRMVLTTRNFIAFIQMAAEEVLGEEGARTIMYRAGFKSGYLFASHQAEVFGLKGREIMEKYLADASSRGWGKITILEFDEHAPSVKIKMEGSYAEEFGNVGKHVCHIWRGGIAGILQYITDKEERKLKIIAKENKCIAAGDPYCEIEAFSFRHSQENHT